MEPLDRAARLQRTMSWAVRMTAGLMLAYMLVVVVAGIGIWLNIFALPDARQMRWATEIFVALGLINWLVWPLWCGLANRALQSRANPRLKSGPLAAALWFICPGAFLFMPWPVVREIYLASEDPTEWLDRKAPIVAFWWWARLVMYFGLLPLSTPLDPQGERFGLALAFQSVIIAELILEIVLMTRMTRWQTRLGMKVAEAF